VEHVIHIIHVFIIKDAIMQACHFSGIVPEINDILFWLPAYRRWWQYCRQL